MSPSRRKRPRSRVQELTERTRREGRELSRRRRAEARKLRPVVAPARELAALLTGALGELLDTAARPPAAGGSHA